MNVSTRFPNVHLHLVASRRDGVGPRQHSSATTRIVAAQRLAVLNRRLDRIIGLLEQTAARELAP